MRILVLGGGGREHALVWSLSRRGGHEVHAAPGNPGMLSRATLHPTDIDDGDAVVALARRIGPPLVVVGP